MLLIIEYSSARMSYGSQRRRFMNTNKRGKIWK